MYNDHDSLAEWKASSGECITGPKDDPVFLNLNEAMKDASFITIRYFGGSSPGTSRSIRPERIFAKNGVAYVEAYCERACETRTFKVDLIQIGEYGYKPRPAPRPAPPPEIINPTASQKNSTSGCVIAMVFGVILGLGGLAMAGPVGFVTLGLVGFFVAKANINN